MDEEQKIETPQTQAETKAPERSWGEAASDVAGNMLSSLANGGKLLNVFAAGLEAGINTDSFQQRKQARANAARLAEVQLQQAEANLEKTRFGNEQAKKLAPLEERLTMAKIANAELTGKNLLQTNEFNAQANPQRLRNLAAQSENSELVLQKNKELVWKNNFDTRKKQIDDNMRKQFGINGLNFTAQTAFEKSQALEAFKDITAITEAWQRDPEAAKYYAEQTGWKLGNDANGTPVLTSPDGKKSFTADDAGLKKIFGEIQKQLQDDITACNIIGKDSQFVGEAVAKVILKNPAVQQIYGTPGTAYSAYRDFLNRSGVDPKTGKARQVFTPEQKTWHSAHILFRTAMEDNVFSPEEMQTLIPQAEKMIKVLGGTLKLGDGIDDTEVIWGADGGLNHTYKLKDFVNSVLAEKDVVSPLFRETMRINLNQQMKNRQGGENGGSEQINLSAVEDQHRNMFGPKWVRLSKEDKEAVIEEEKILSKTAVALNLGTIDKNGKTHLITPDDISGDNIDNIKIMAKNEKKALKKYEIDPESGYWNRMLEALEQQQEWREQQADIIERMNKEAEMRNVKIPSYKSKKYTAKNMANENRTMLARIQAEYQNKGKK